MKKYNVLFLGNSGSGKTSLWNRGHGYLFSSYYEPTIGMPGSRIHMQYDQTFKEVGAQFYPDADIGARVVSWELAGSQDTLNWSIINPVLAAVFITVDLSKTQSVEEAVRPWKDLVDKKYPATSPFRPEIVLVGTKSDLDSDNKIEALKNYACAQNYRCLVTSSRDNKCLEYDRNGASVLVAGSKKGTPGAGETIPLDEIGTSIAHGLYHLRSSWTEDKITSKTLTYLDIYIKAESYSDDNRGCLGLTKSIKSCVMSEFLLNRFTLPNGKRDPDTFNRAPNDFLSHNDKVRFYIIMGLYMGTSQGKVFNEMLKPIYNLLAQDPEVTGAVDQYMLDNKETLKQDLMWIMHKIAIEHQFILRPAWRSESSTTIAKQIIANKGDLQREGCLQSYQHFMDTQEKGELKNSFQFLDTTVRKVFGVKNI